MKIRTNAKKSVKASATSKDNVKPLSVGQARVFTYQGDPCVFIGVPEGMIFRWYPDSYGAKSELNYVKNVIKKFPDDWEENLREYGFDTYDESAEYQTWYAKNPIKGSMSCNVTAGFRGEPTLDKLLGIVQSWVGLIDNYYDSGKQYPTAVINDLHASMKGVLRDFGVTASCNKKAVKASYGRWGKFYGLNDVEFTVPNDTDDPTIYYNGNYYNYYAIEDTLWDYYKDECAENGVSPDENEFEKWVADNSYYVYDLLDEIQPKSEPGRGVYRENDNTLRKSIKSSRQRRAVKASYTYKYAVWVLDGDDNTWKCWSGKDSTDLGMSEDEFLDSINHQTYPNPEYNVDNNYVDVMVIDGDKTPADYGQTENVKEYGEIAESTRRAVKADMNKVSSFRVKFQEFLGKVSREVADSLYQYDDAVWDVKGTISPSNGSYWCELNLWCDDEEAGTVNIEYTNDTFNTSTDAFVVSVPDTDEIQAEGNSFADIYDTCVGELIRMAEDYVNFVRY
jgi:hypothetical protein